MSRRCTELKRDTHVKVEENKRKAVFRNSSRDAYEVSTIDGCLVTSGPRADYLVSKKNVASALIELKGSDISHACEQLFASFRNANVAPLLEEKVGFLVICSKYPRFDSFVIRAKQRAAREHKSGFHVVCNKGEFDIERIVEIDGPY